MRPFVAIFAVAVTGGTIGGAALSHAQADRLPAVSQATTALVTQKASDEKPDRQSAANVQKSALGEKKRRRDRQEPALVLTPAREAAALAFVRNHHPELVELVDRLKETSPAEYKAVVSDLFRNSERLAALEESDPARYELALRAWKIKSRIHLLGARASLSDDESIRLELRGALEEQAQIRLEQLRFERDAIAERQKKAEAALARFEQDRAGHVDRQYDMLIRQIERAGVKAKALKQKKAIKRGKAKKRADGEISK
jgi:hypothetical protein